MGSNTFLLLQRDFILHRIGTGSVDVTLSEAKGLATFGNEILHVVQHDMAHCSTIQHNTIEDAFSSSTNISGDLEKT